MIPESLVLHCLMALWGGLHLGTENGRHESICIKIWEHLGIMCFKLDYTQRAAGRGKRKLKRWTAWHENIDEKGQKTVSSM